MTCFAQHATGDTPPDPPDRPGHRTDADLRTLTRTLRALADDEPVLDGQRHGVEEIEHIVACLRTQAREALRRAEVTPRFELECLLTDACAQGMAIEAERVCVKRQLVAMLAGRQGPAVEASEFGVLRDRYLRIIEALDELRCIQADLRGWLDHDSPAGQKSLWGSGGAP